MSWTRKPYGVTPGYRKLTIDIVRVGFACAGDTAQLTAVSFHRRALPLTAGSPLVSSTHELPQITADYQWLILIHATDDVADHRGNDSDGAGHAKVG